MDRDYLAHHGILGQKWGVRRYQNKDGSLTQQGRTRYSDSETNSESDKKNYTKHASRKFKKLSAKAFEDYQKESSNISDRSTKKTEQIVSKKWGNRDIKSTRDADQYMKLWDDTYTKVKDREVLSFINTSKSFKKAIDYASRFNEKTYDSLTKENMDFIKELRKSVEGRR